ncbi:MAG TPA: DUF2071 domain-containing protein [Micromonosporaceae bacterium]|nr:DUF2071 domain-containing protein [Micromonosporaceae bacterium]
MTEPVTREAPRVLRRVLLTQEWRDLAFLHWPVPPEDVAPLLPPGTEPDVFDGTSWVGLVAFRMWRIGLFRTPGLPYLGTFPETNVRLYSVDAKGRRAVVFRSLEASRLVPVLVARSVFRLPYMWARMSIDRRGDEIRYGSRRRWPRGAGRPRTRVAVRVRARRSDPTPLEDFFTARWGLSSDWYGRTRYLPNVHPAWPLHDAELLDLDDELLAAAGLPGLRGVAPASVLYSPGVPVRFGPPLPD